MPLTRSRVIDRIRAATTYPISLVLAPAGFGKTTAIRQALASFDNTIVVATPSGATLEQFVDTFARCCSLRYPAMAVPPYEEVPAQDHFDRQVELYASWAIVHLRDSESIIVVDDLQNSDHDPAVSAFLIKVADALKDRIRWIFSSRTHSNLPITRWQAYGDADAPLTAQALRMSVPEAIEFALSLGCPATSDEIARWVDQTHGFPVPIAYAIRLAAHRGVVDEIMDGTRSVTFSFLAEQLWASLRIPERTLLEVAAFLPPLHPHVYDDAGLDNASGFIFHLCDEIAFLELTPVGIFSMHDLFRDFIKQQVLRSGPHVQRSRIATAVRALLVAEYYSDALELLLEYSDTNALTDSVEHLPDIDINPSLKQAIVSATSRVDLSDLGPALLCIQTEYWSWFGDSHKSMKYAEALLKRPDVKSKHLLCVVRAISRVTNFQNEGHQRAWLARMKPIVSRLSEADRALGHAYHASFLARYQETQGEAQSLVREIRHEIELLEPSSRIDAQVAIGTALYYTGDNSEAVDATRDAVATALTINNQRELARSLNNLGLMLLLLFDAEVVCIFDPLRDAVEKTGSWRFAHVSHWMQTSYYALAADLPSATASQAIQLAITPSEESQRTAYAHVRRHSANLCHVIAEEYSAVLDDYNRSALPRARDAAYEIHTSAAAAYAFTFNVTEGDRALSSSEALRESFSSLELRTVLPAQLMAIVAAGALGRWQHARRLFEKQDWTLPSLALLKRGLESFCGGPPFPGVLEAMKPCLRQPFIGLTALLVMRVVERDAMHRSELSLTAAELEVLRLVALGRSNKEIATVRSRSVETVKRQVASLYQKLGVENRTSAVAVARSRGLV